MLSEENLESQPLTAFLRAEGLYARIETGLREVAAKLSCDKDAFSRSGLAALDGWTVQPSRAVSRFGSVDPRTRTLRLTTLDCSREARVDTILHEVAHIVSDHLMRRRERHGPQWKQIARALGARPIASGQDERFRRAAEQLRASRLKTVALCGRCGFEIKRMRRSRRNWRRFIHRECGGRFSAVG